MTNELNKVKEFMTACGQMVNVVPTIPDEGTRQMRHSILIEEVNELQYAETNIDALDAITDILYVLLGTAHAYGLGDKLEAAFNEVHRSNMTKVMPDGKVLKREDGKIIKPDTYEPPNLQKYMDNQNTEPTPDMVNHPPHYNVKGFEVIDIIDAFGLNFNMGNALKYLLRADRKGNKEQDIQKALWYLQREINKSE
jgi:predicted HAD superfamily Cof-like phosphohydrolase